MSITFECYWGIDVSKEWVDVDIGNKIIRIIQTEQAIKEFIKNNKVDNKKY